MIKSITSGAGEARYPEVGTYADLPDVTAHRGKLFIVRTATGIFAVNRKRAGIYRSDGITWKRLGEIILAGAESPSSGFLVSNPPSGKNVATNVYYDPNLDRVVIEKESIPVP